MFNLSGSQFGNRKITGGMSNPQPATMTPNKIPSMQSQLKPGTLKSGNMTPPATSMSPKFKTPMGGNL